jgi:hypothetical protein
LVEYIHALPEEIHPLILDELLGPSLGPKFSDLFEPIFGSFVRSSMAAEEPLKILASKLRQFCSDIKGISFILAVVVFF